MADRKVVVKKTNEKVIVKKTNEKIIVRAAGARGPAGGTSYFKGHGLPSSSIGAEGDSYLDLDTSLLYTKTAGAWGNAVQSVARAAISYLHTQNAELDTWTIPHNLGFHPAVSVMDFSGINIECEVKHDLEGNEVELKFYLNGLPVRVSGYAYLS